jgi:hypothetical protein
MLHRPVRSTISLSVLILVILTTSEAQYTQQGSKLVGTGAAGGAAQGISVALSADGNTAIMGGYTDDGAHGAA